MERAARMRRSLKETPLRLEVSALLESLNQEFLRGDGRVGWSPGEEGPTDTVFAWGWDGRKTKGKRIRLKHLPSVTVTPFLLEVTVTKHSPESPLHFRVTANYKPDDEAEDIIVAELPNLDTELLERVIRNEKNHILHSRKL